MNKQKLIEILSIQSVSYNQTEMIDYIAEHLLTMAGVRFVIEDDSIYIVKGEAYSYPCVIAHLDTVHPICEDLTVLDIKGRLTGFNAVQMKQTGIGGDDKVGIYIALECLNKFDNIKVVFFRDEETGCEGSYNANIPFFDDCNFVLQCDRQKHSDFITNASGVELCSKAFKKDVKPILDAFGYSFSSGLMTDVMALKELGIACSMANISCGYYNPHTDYEYVNVAYVENCLNLVYAIIEKLGKTRYGHTYKAPHSSYKADAIYSYYTKHFKDTIKPAKDLCDSCMESIPIDDMKYVRDYNVWVCPNCYKWVYEDDYIPKKHKPSKTDELPF